MRKPVENPDIAQMAEDLEDEEQYQDEGDYEEEEEYGTDEPSVILLCCVSVLRACVNMCV